MASLVGAFAGIYPRAAKPVISSRTSGYTHPALVRSCTKTNQRRFSLRATRLTERLAEAAALFADLVAFFALLWVFLMARRALERTLVATRTSCSFSSPSDWAVRLAPATTLPAAEPRVSLKVTRTSSSADAVIKSPLVRFAKRTNHTLAEGRIT